MTPTLVLIFFLVPVWRALEEMVLRNDKTESITVSGVLVTGGHVPLAPDQNPIPGFQTSTSPVPSSRKRVWQVLDPTFPKATYNTYREENK